MSGVVWDFFPLFFSTHVVFTCATSTAKEAGRKHKKTACAEKDDKNFEQVRVVSLMGEWSVCCFFPSRQRECEHAKITAPESLERNDSRDTQS